MMLLTHLFKHKEYLLKFIAKLFKNFGSSMHIWTKYV